jgi:NAD(P)H dehydrogenase (quinone)
LTDSLAGVDRLLFISSQPGGAVARLTQHQNVVKAAQTAGVALIAYTSFPHVETAKSPLSSDHQATEALIKETGIQHTFLRNNWYLENEMSFIQGGQQNQPFVYSAGQGRVGWALERYYAQAAAQVILLDEPRPVYEFAGESRTYADLATAVHQVTGHDFPVKSVSDAAYTQGLQQAGIDAQTATVITSLQTLIRDGDLAETTDDLATVLGTALPALTDQVREILK